MTKLLDIFSSKKLKQKEKPIIIIDNREKNSLVPSELKKLGSEITFKHLPVADYLINNIAIERKTSLDLQSSIINKRIISQLLELKQFPKHFLILEGQNQDKIIHENAFRGLILAILQDYQVPIIFSKDEEDTAKYIYILAKNKPKSEISLRPSKIFLSEKEQLQYILEGFPQIGPKTAKKLLEHFKSLKSFINATEEKLKSLIGKKSHAVYRLINLQSQSN